jgi:hypothetical protein
MKMTLPVAYHGEHLTASTITLRYDIGQETEIVISLRPSSPIDKGSLRFAISHVETYEPPRKQLEPCTIARPGQAAHPRTGRTWLLVRPRKSLPHGVRA